MVLSLTPGQRVKTYSWQRLWTTHVQTNTEDGRTKNIRGSELFETKLSKFQSSTLALVTLLSQAPDEFLAMRAERGLPMKCSHEFVSVDLMDAPSHRTAAAIETGTLLELLWLFDRCATAFTELHHDMNFAAWLQVDLSQEEDKKDNNTSILGMPFFILAEQVLFASLGLTHTS